jgi:RHH-type proline utilization regulon transcriptional repressor/proline dehydrogenase/delta 1-pyrroline-5-carboxylate dehydrogenase
MASPGESTAAADALERDIRRVGAQLAAAFPAPLRHPVKALDERAMGYAAEDRAVRAALFRFVDVAPACRSLDELARHLTNLLAEVDEPPPPVAAAMRMGTHRASRAALGAAAAAGVRHMAHRFIVGESVDAALGLLKDLWHAGVASSIDLLGEATLTEAEADAYAARCRSAMRSLAPATAAYPARAGLESDGLGALPRGNLSVKVTALTPLLRPEAPELGERDAAGRLVELLRLADDLGLHLHVDMESLDTREAIFDLVLDLLARPELAAGPSAGLVIQAYLRDSAEQLERVLAWAEHSARKPPLVIRLVKGAYWDHEIVEARQHGWTPPVFESKADCDRNFEALTRRLLEARPVVRVAVASHNLRSVAHAIAYNRLTGGLDRDLELQVLRGLGDDLQHALAVHGLRVRAYCPVGDLVSGMAYLIRRLLENTSNESFLARSARGESLDVLLAAP